MIDKDGNLFCDRCGAKLAIKLDGYLEIYCRKCKHFNIFGKKEYQSHKVLDLTNNK